MSRYLLGAALAILSVPAFAADVTAPAANDFSARFNVGGATNWTHINTDVIGSGSFFGATNSGSFSIRPFVGADILVGHGLGGVEVESALGQNIFKSQLALPIGDPNAGLSHITTASEWFRGSVRIGYEVGSVIPYLRAGAAFLEYNSTVGVPPTLAITVKDWVALIGAGIEARYRFGFVRIEANYLGFNFAPKFPTGGYAYSPAVGDYEARLAVGFTY